MAMDKETLLQRLQTQYLTRQEVLYKLPLNISINTFWPELINRRKMNSIILPLHRGDGKPYWYVLTDKMIAASEKLCTLALECSNTAEPYRSGMTSAMLEELFFTSFVEGAQISVQDAMQFLERGTEPENVQEQLIQNNRAAWADMIKMLYYPLSENIVRGLAYRLTDELDNHATDYRQTDAHPIVAMGSETYTVPAAAALPSLMQEYYRFLADTETHPLIKAAVGQAYLLVVRPFPEGNERLSRMISYAILLRCGYDFFRDISISSLIARENFRYYKSMQDIIREENSGDLTYFIEYYLDLLGRAVDIKAEQDRHSQQEALEAERQAAKRPLAVAEAAVPAPSPPPPKDYITETDIIYAMESAELDTADACRLMERYRSGEMIERDELNKLMEPQVHEEKESQPEENPTEEIKPAESPPIEWMTQEEYEKKLADMEANEMGKIQAERKQRITSTIRKFLAEGRFCFTRLEWEKSNNGISKDGTKNDLNVMCKLGLVYC